MVLVRSRSALDIIAASFVLAIPAAAFGDGSLACPRGSAIRSEQSADGRAEWCVADDLFGAQKKNGPFKRWRRDGSIASEGEFIDGKRHGDWVEYDRAGNVTREARYHFGTLVSSSGQQPSATPPVDTQHAERAPPIV